MDIENPEIPEGINVSPTHPLKELAWLLASITGAIVPLFSLLGLAVSHLVVYVPFALEQRVAAEYIRDQAAPDAMRDYLQTLADDLVIRMGVPRDMPITVHYEDDSTRNAFATVGGNIYLHRGLIDMLDNENALAMVVAHEISHVQHRHPLVAMGRGVVIVLLMVSLSGIDGNEVIGRVVNLAGSVTLLDFSRGQERRADQDALAAVVARYGHAGGAMDFFEMMLQEGKNNRYSPEFLSTHPLDATRIRELTELARERGWTLDGQLSPLPTFAGRE